MQNKYSKVWENEEEEEKMQEIEKLSVRDLNRNHLISSIFEERFNAFFCLGLWEEGERGGWMKMDLGGDNKGPSLSLQIPLLFSLRHH